MLAQSLYHVQLANFGMLAIGIVNHTNILVIIMRDHCIETREDFPLFNALGTSNSSLSRSLNNSFANLGKSESFCWITHTFYSHKQLYIRLTLNIPNPAGHKA